MLIPYDSHHSLLFTECRCSLACMLLLQMGQLISFEKKPESPSVLPLSKNYQPNPESRANFLSHLLFWWTGEILDVGTKAYKARGGLEVTELFPLVQQDQAAVLYNDFKVREVENASLYISIIYIFLFFYFFGFLL